MSDQLLGYTDQTGGFIVVMSRVVQCLPCDLMEMQTKTKKETTKKQYVEEKNETLIKVHPPKRAYSLHTQSGKAKNTAQTHTLTKINK